MPLKYQFGTPATTGWEMAAREQRMREIDKPMQVNYEQMAQQAFGPAPETAADFAPAQQVSLMQPSAPTTQLDTSALGGTRPPSMIEVPEQTIQMRVQTPQQKQAVEKENAMQKAAMASELSAQALESEVRSAAYAKASEQFESARQEYLDAQKELTAKKTLDPAGKWGTVEKIGAAIAMGLGAYASAFNGGRNYAAEIIDSSIKRDLQMQEMEMNRLGKNVDEKKNALAFAYGRFGDIEKAKDAVYAASLSGITEDLKDKIAATKSARAKANGDAMLASLATKQAQAAERTNEMLVTKSSKMHMADMAKPAAMTESQGKAYAYVESMKQAEPILASLEKYGATIGGSAAQRLPQAVMPEKAKQLAQAQEAFAEGYIRFASGANVPKSEIESTLRRAMPSPGDSEKALAQKRAYRAQLIRSMEVVSKGRQPSEQDQTTKLKSQLGFNR